VGNRSSSPDSRRRRFTSARSVVSWDIPIDGGVFSSSSFFSWGGGCEFGII